jgi:acyl dehydratase
MDHGYFEDIGVGQESSFGSYEVEEAEIIEFGERYDPQAFHTDPEAAQESMFGDLVASGWHTCAMTMRLLVENELQDSKAMGAIGVDELRWKQPVFPGDTLRVETTVLAKEDWQPGVGLVRSQTKTFNQDDREVCSFVGLVLYEKRD